VSKDYPCREIGDRGFGSSIDKRSGLSIVETPRYIWTIRLTEAMCQKITHIGKSGIGDSGVPLTRDWDFPLWKP
jgi:hypothetical protein